MKDLLQSLLKLSEGETKDTKTGRVHKGTYGSEYDTDKDGNEKKKEAPAAKKGRGRPKKDADSSGEVKSYDTKSLGSVFGGGQKPKKEVGTVSKKHSLKEYIESTEQMKKFEAVMEGMFGGVDHSSVAANLGKLAKVIKSVQTPEQFAVAQKYARRMSGTIMNHQHDKLGFGAGIKANMGIMRAVQDDLMAKAKELGIPYNALEETEALSVKPMPGAAQITDPSGNPVATADAATANMMKQAAAQGKLTIGGQQQGMAEGKKAKPDFLDVDKDSDKKEPFKKAVKDKEAKKKVDESRDQESSEYLDEKVAKILAREKPGMATVSSNDEFYGAIYHELIACGLTPKAARYKVSYDEDFIADVASAYNHYQKNPSLDEGALDDFRIHGVEPTNDFTEPGSSTMAVPRTAPAASAVKKEPTPWSVDPINAATDRVGSFISSLGKKNSTFEGKGMKDMQVESWTKQLNGLLTEGLTVSSSTGQQGQPNSVTVSATEGDADQLMQVLRSAGIGGFGAGEQQPEIGYGVAQGGEEDFNGTGTEPQPSPDVVGDDGDMLSMLKKMAGLDNGEAEVVAIGGDAGGEEGSEDYKDEEGGEQVGTLEPTDSDEEDASDDEEGEDEEEQTDEGNAFTGKLKQTPQGGEFKMGDKSYKDTSSIEEGGFDPEQPEGGAGGGDISSEEEICETCHMESCECEHEQVEENFANSANDPAQEELMKLKALLAMGNDLHKQKSSQAMGNPVRVAESNTINDWKKLSGIK